MTDATLGDGDDQTPIAYCAGCDEPVLFEDEGHKPENCTCDPEQREGNLGDLFG